MNTVPGNYLEHAVADFNICAAPSSKRGFGETIRVYEELIPFALKAPRFLLPDGGILIDRKFSHLSLPIRLPYPMTVLEFNATETEKRVVIAVEEMYLGEMLPRIAVYSFIQLTGPTTPVVRWFPGFEIVFLKVDKTPVEREGSIEFSVLDLLKNPPRLNIVSEKIRMNTDQLALRVLSLIQALQCCNVDVETIPAPHKLNAKRIAKGKLPFVEYKILTVGHDPSALAVPMGGSHASPRQHLRRGHIRRLTDARTVWVNQCMVGNPNKGSVIKDYRVNA